MSKFENLCESFKKAQAEFQQFKDDSIDFAEDLWDKMIYYFEIPPTQISLYRVDEDGEWEIVPPMMLNALTLQEDAYWQVGLGITLYEKIDSFPQETLIIGLLLKRDGKNLFKIKLYGYDKDEFKIDKTNAEDFNKFFDFIFTHIQKNYQTGFQTFLDQDTTIRKIGYKSS